MTSAEQNQLRLWSQYDGYYLCGLWVVGFIALMNSALVQGFGLINEVIILATPFFLLWRLKRFRDEGRGGEISFGRSLLFLARMVMMAAMIFGLVQYLYLAFWDDGQLPKVLYPIVSTPESVQMLKQMGMTVEQYLNEVAGISPLSFACTCFLLNLLACAVISILLAVLCSRTGKATQLRP